MNRFKQILEHTKEFHAQMPYSVDFDISVRVYEGKRPLPQWMHVVSNWLQFVWHEINLEVCRHFGHKFVEDRGGGESCCRCYIFHP